MPQRHHIEHDLERYFTAGGQGTKIGNITDRIYEVCQFLNSAIGTAHGDGWGPFPRRQVCWHSDEAARPFVDDVDLPIFAATPAGNEVGIETIFDFKVFIRYCRAQGINVTLGEGWTLDSDARKRNRLGGAFRPPCAELGPGTHTRRTANRSGLLQCLIAPVSRRRHGSCAGVAAMVSSANPREGHANPAVTGRYPWGLQP